MYCSAFSTCVSASSAKPIIGVPVLQDAPNVVTVWIVMEFVH